MMRNNNFLFQPGHSKKSTLDKAYQKHVNNLLKTLDEDEEYRWDSYSIVIEQLMQQGKKNYFDELKYRVSDGENPNKVMLDIIEREYENIDGLTWYFKRRIEEYLEEDYFKRFYL